jgi:hypothetical protein
MRFWTIQPREVWQQMRRGDSVRVDPEHLKYGGERPWQYDWLSAALSRSRSGFDGGWAWWLCCEEPDLGRSRSATLPGGPEQALIELELPEDRCATFPLWMWETIYTRHYIALTREELDNWYRELHSAVPNREVWPLPEPWRSRLESSWERMFDLSVDPRCWYRDDELPDEGSELYALMRDASDEMAGLTQELLASDTMNVTLFTTTG